MRKCALFGVFILLHLDIFSQNLELEEFFSVTAQLSANQIIYTTSGMNLGDFLTSVFFQEVSVLAFMVGVFTTAMGIAVSYQEVRWIKMF